MTLQRCFLGNSKTNFPPTYQQPLCSAHGEVQRRGRLGGARGEVGEGEGEGRAGGEQQEREGEGTEGMNGGKRNAFYSQGNACSQHAEALCRMMDAGRITAWLKVSCWKSTSICHYNIYFIRMTNGVDKRMAGQAQPGQEEGRAHAHQPGKQHRLFLVQFSAS